VIGVPSYSSLDLPSRSGNISLIYSVAKPHAEFLCATDGALGVDTYWMEVPPYLCSPYFSQQGKLHQIMERVVPTVFNMSVLAGESRNIRIACGSAGPTPVSAVLVDLADPENPGLRSCEALHEALSHPVGIAGLSAFDDQMRCSIPARAWAIINSR
jgi:hypothetical protein